MRTFLLCYCRYDLNNYMGHRMEWIEAESYNEAKVKAKKFLEGLWIKCDLEFVLTEVVGPGIKHYRTWDTRADEPDAQLNRKYTEDHFWNKLEAEDQQ